MKIFCDSGHWQGDPGAIVGNLKENELTMKIRDELKWLLYNNYNACFVPDNLNLRDSIKWVNDQNPASNDLAISIHLNSNSDSNVSGCEAYYFTTPRFAEIFSRQVSKALGITNLGPRPDTRTYVGSLGWLRFIKCDSVVVEVCYLTNPLDLKALDYKKAAEGIKAAIDELNPITPDIEEQKKTILKKIIELYQIIIKLLLLKSKK